MLPVSTEDWVALGPKAGTLTSQTVARAQYQGAATVLNVAPEGNLTWDADGSIQSNGGLRVFGFGDSLIPRSRTDVLAPYGQEIAITREVHLRSRVLHIPLGVYRIVGNDGGRFNQRDGVVLDWEVGVDLADRFRMIERGKIVNPASPPSGATMYSELQRLSLFPIEVAPAVADRAVPRALVYDDRMSGVHDLAALAGAKPRLTRQGALTVRPADRWLTEPVSAAQFDIEGTIHWSDEQTDEFYNYVRAKDPDGRHVGFAALDDDSDPRSVNRAGPSTYEHSSPVYTSMLAATEGARTALARLLNRRSRVVTVQVGLQGLLLDLSDVGWVRDPAQGRAVFGEVSGLRVPHDPTAPVEVTLVVAEER